MTESEIRALATLAVERVAKNASVAEQLYFPHIYLTLKEALSNTAPALAGDAQPVASDLTEEERQFIARKCERIKNAAQPAAAPVHAASFQDWYTGISIEGDMKHNMRRAWDAALSKQPAAAPDGAIYVECRECSQCEHVGINDSSAALAACHNCDWSGPSPTEDHCPGCADKGCMGAACPKCGGLYRLLAESTVAAPSIPAAVGWEDWRRALAEKVDNYITVQAENEGSEPINEVYDDLKAHILKTPFAPPVAAVGVADGAVEAALKAAWPYIKDIESVAKLFDTAAPSAPAEARNF